MNKKTGSFKATIFKQLELPKVDYQFPRVTYIQMISTQLNKQKYLIISFGLLKCE